MRELVGRLLQIKRGNYVAIRPPKGLRNQRISATGQPDALGKGNQQHNQRLIDGPSRKRPGPSRNSHKGVETQDGDGTQPRPCGKADGCI